MLTMADSFMTVREIAQLFRLRREETVREWIRAGLFPHVVRRGGFLVTRADVDALIQQSKVVQSDVHRALASQTRARNRHMGRGERCQEPLFGLTVVN